MNRYEDYKLRSMIKEQTIAVRISKRNSNSCFFPKVAARCKQIDYCIDQSQHVIKKANGAFVTNLIFLAL